MERWRSYQRRSARLFKRLGCIADMDATVKGVRTPHRIDVWVRFLRFGVRQRWVIECKLWNRKVSKGAVLTLRGVVEDVGADRGVLIAEAGCQRGAHQLAQSSNITLTTLRELQRSAAADLLAQGLSSISKRSARLTKEAHSAFAYGPVTSTKGTISATAQVKPGFDPFRLMRTMGLLSFLKAAVEQARLGNFPVLVEPVSSGRDVWARTPRSFVRHASRLLNRLEAELRLIVPSTKLTRRVDRVAGRAARKAAD